jgi:hypothetical protein
MRQSQCEVRRLLLLMAGICVAAAPATAPSTAPALADELVRIDSVASKVEDLTADFEQRKYSPLLRDPLITRGTIRAKGAALIWRSEEPEVTRTRVTLDRLQIFYARQNVVEEYPIAGKLGALAASPLPRLATLRERFTITRDAGDNFAAAEGGDRLTLRLDPIDAEVKQYVGHIRVLLDMARGLVLSFEMVDPDGERTTISFTPDAELELGAPKDAKFVKPLEPGK